MVLLASPDSILLVQPFSASLTIFESYGPGELCAFAICISAPYPRTFFPEKASSFLIPPQGSRHSYRSLFPVFPEQFRSSNPRAVFSFSHRDSPDVSSGFSEVYFCRLGYVALVSC